MAVRPVLTLGNPLLREVAREIRPEELGTPWLARLVEDMIDTMHHEEGIGIAAPQVGVLKRVIVLDIDREEVKTGPLFMANPEVIEASDEDVSYEEGCLSFPGIYADVERPERCRVAFQDVDGEEHEQEFDGFTSRVVQHEYDHLEGVLLVDRMSTADKLRNKGALEELVETYRDGNDTPKRRRRR